MIVTDQDDYRASDAVSFSRLRVFERCPFLYFKRFIERSTAPEEETKALRVGSAAHCMILEGPRAFSERYAVKPECYVNASGEEKPWNANAKICEAWEENQRALGRTVVSRSEGDLLIRMREAVRTNAHAVTLLTRGGPEVGIRRPYPALRLELQGRLDWYHTDGIVVDLKTIECLDDLKREIERREYYRQLAFYRHLAAEEFGTAGIRCAVIGVEKTEPFRCGVYYLSEPLLAIGDAYNFAALANLARTMETGEWGGNPETVTLEPSPDLLFQAMERKVL